MKSLSKKIVNPRNIFFLISALLCFLVFAVYQNLGSGEIVFKAEGQKKYRFGENLLINPGFEETGSWKSYGEGYEIDKQIRYSGNQSMKTLSNDADKSYGAFQGIGFDLEPGEEKKIVIGGWSRNEGEVAEGGKLHADVYSRDGSETQYGLIVDFDSSMRHTWQYNEKIFTIKKPSYIVLYVMVREQIGAPVYFDDIFVAEVIEEVDKGFSVFDDIVISIPGKRKDKKNRATYSLKTQDGLSLSLAKNGVVQSLNIDGKEFVYEKSIPISGFFVRDVAEDSDFIRVEGLVSQVGEKIQQKHRLKSLELEFDNTYVAKRGYIEISGKIKNVAEKDRAITVFGVWFWSR